VDKVEPRRRSTCRAAPALPRYSVQLTEEKPMTRLSPWVPRGRRLTASGRGARRRAAEQAAAEALLAQLEKPAGRRKA
jgi:hypothetical protein